MNKAKTRLQWYKRPVAKMLFFGAIGIALLAMISSAIAYTAWQSSSEKALFDAVDYARKSPASYHVTSVTGSDYTVTTDGAQIMLEGEIEGVKVAAVADGKNLYFKSKEQDKLINLMTRENISKGTSKIKFYRYALIDQLDGDRWSLINVDDLDSGVLGGAALRCGTALRASISETNDSFAQLQTTYQSNQFVQTMSRADSSAVLTAKFVVHNDKLRSFFSDLMRASIGQQSANCGYVPNYLDNLKSDKVTFVVTITKPDHHFKKLVIKKGDKELATVTAKYAKQKDIQIPAGAQDMGRIFSTILQPELATPSTDS